MPTRTEQIFRIRTWLGNPFPQKPDLHRILMQELAEEQDILNAVNNTGKAWATAEFQLNLNPNEDTYQISATDFGKPIFVIRPTGNDYQPYISVPFTDVAELDYNTVWDGFTDIYTGLYGADVTPEKMAFYRTGAVDPSYMVKVQPMPSTNHTYTITYLVGYLGQDDPLSVAVTMPEHAVLIQLRAALALLPDAEWYEDEERNYNRRKSLAASFLEQLERKESNFKTYVSTLSHGRIVDTDDWY